MNTMNQTEAAEMIVKTTTVTLRDENDGDLCCISEMRDAEREPLDVVFGPLGSMTATVTYADDATGSAQERIETALEDDEDVVKYSTKPAAR